MRGVIGLPRAHGGLLPRFAGVTRQFAAAAAPGPPKAESKTAQQSSSSSDSSRTVYMSMIGNAGILVMKAAVWMRTGSSAMLAETIHTAADTANQALLVMGMQQSQTAADTRHPYGYGKAAWFWSLVSALGMFWCGAGVSIAHGVWSIMHPSPVETGIEAAVVLAASLAVDGYVLSQAVSVILDRARAREAEALDPAHSDYDSEGGGVQGGAAHTAWLPPRAFAFDAAAPLRSALGMLRSTVWYVRSTRDPYVTSVFLEDTVACSGVIAAAAGITLSHVTGNPLWDGLASIAIGGMLGGVAMQLVRMNKRYLMGHTVEGSVLSGIQRILLSRPSIEAVGDVQSQYTGPSEFAYKAEVDFDGTYLSARLQSNYRELFLRSARAGTLEADLPLLLSYYAEDVTRLVERELKAVERDIRAEYPGAVYIELEPDSINAEQPMHHEALDARARLREEKDIWSKLSAILEKRAAKRPDDQTVVDERTRLNQWFKKAEARRAQTAGVSAVTPLPPPPPTPTPPPAVDRVSLSTVLSSSVFGRAGGAESEAPAVTLESLVPKDAACAAAASWQVAGESEQEHAGKEHTEGHVEDALYDSTERR